MSSPISGSKRCLRLHKVKSIQLVTCACKDCHVEPEEVIQDAYSVEHAIDLGWRSTHNIQYVNPKNGTTAYLCPECIRRKMEDRANG